MIVVIVTLIGSTVCGAYAISTIWKQGEGREGKESPAWGTYAVKGYLDAQAFTGLAALFLFVVIIPFRNSDSTSNSQQSMALQKINNQLTTMNEQMEKRSRQQSIIFENIRDEIKQLTTAVATAHQSGADINNLPKVQ